MRNDHPAAVTLRKVAAELYGAAHDFAAHLYDEPRDVNDRDGVARWKRLSAAAVEYTKQLTRAEACRFKRAGFGKLMASESCVLPDGHEGRHMIEVSDTEAGSR